MPEISRRFGEDREAGEQSFVESWRLLALGLVGFGYFFFLAALLAGIAGLLALLAVAAMRSHDFVVIGAMAAALIALAYAVVRSLWLELSTPQGVILTREQTPRLFDELDQAIRLTSSRPMGSVLLSDQFRADIVPVGHVGPLLDHDKALVLGLPLLQALSPTQLRSLLVRELAAQSPAAGRFAAWIGELRRVWLRLAQTLQARDGLAAFIARWFSHRYAQILEAQSLGLMRRHESASDRIAAELTGAENVRQLLLNLAVSHAYLEEAFWPGIYQRADDMAEPPQAPYDELATSLEIGFGVERKRSWLSGALDSPTYSAEGPTLRRRLLELGCDVDLPEVAFKSAAEHYLREAYPALRQTLNDAWRDGIGDAWRQWHAHVQASRKGFAQPLPTGQKDSSPAAAWQRACYVEEFDGAEEALPLYREFIERHPSHAGANFAIGRILASQQNPEGIDYLLRAMKLDDVYEQRATHLVRQFFGHHERRQGARDQGLVARKPSMGWQDRALAPARVYAKDHLWHQRDAA